MKTVGIGIDLWKFSIFERHLKNAGYEFVSAKFVGDSLMLRVKVADDKQQALAQVVLAANQECARTIKDKHEDI